MKNNKSRAVFIDRDGVINKEVPLLHKVEELELIERSAQAIKILNDIRFPVFVVSNQPVVSRGTISEEDVIKINNELNNMLFKDAYARVNKFYFCPHHPHSKIKKYRIACNCRKPMPGLIQKAAKENNIIVNESYMIGDRNVDILSGKKAGCKITILVRSGKNKPIISASVSKKDIEKIKPNYIVDDLYEAVELIRKLEVKNGNICGYS